MRTLTVYCESFGCQMNAYDTDGIGALLEGCGHRIVGSPDAADCIIVNTCSVREHAEQRAIGRLLDLSRHREAVIVVCGCMAQRMGARLFDLVPAVKVVAGTDSYFLLPEAISNAVDNGERSVFIELGGSSVIETMPEKHEGPVSRYVAITRGCENYCSYCIVPYLRGKVRSRSVRSIMEEVDGLAESGAREVTLLGQNVIAFRDGSIGFGELARKVLDETPIRRLRFLTSHPRDVGADVFELMAAEKRFCSHIHLPVQAGSNRILEAMNRGYSRETYLAKVRMARSIVPDIAITTDIIVGFPSETDADFRETIDLVREAGFDAAFTFQYSPRSGTAASLLADDVPAETKKERLHALNSVVMEKRANMLGAQVGATAEILLDGAAQKGEYRFLKGRTPQFRNVLVPRENLREGDMVLVVLRRLANFTFEGEVVAER
ncbi:MAG: tRNA (N6-isopentenyl adenosine(37)-C2)-methylthiotransferase MiaB [Candidatus Krumholzibacteria bacterium]|nr:tRNA (N6-isopentenyl adenosine(37)-C2)-methylthiotransferase MiaB [Candidatus Krumholzibacteria bacterium]